MATTYSDLVAAVPVIMMAQNRSLLDADTLQLLVRQAEDEIIELLDHDAFRKTLPNTVPVSPDVPVIDMEAEAGPVLEVRALRLLTPGGAMPMERREIERLNALYPDLAQGVPRFYGEDESPLRLRVFPTPDDTYQVQVSANVTPARLTSEIQTSVLTQRYPRILEMTVYKHAARFMRNQTDEARYGSLAEAALTGANMQIARRRRDETATTEKSTANRVG